MSQVPGPPIISRLPLATNNQLEFWWQPPSTINNPITYYQIKSSAIGYSTNLSSQTQQTRITNLTNGQYYQFTIAAGNQYGLGSPAAFDPVQPGPRPANNYMTEVKMINKGPVAQVNWKSTQAAGEPDNIGYAIIAVPSTPTLSIVKVSANSTQQTTLIGPLEKDVYTFSVYSVNSARWQRAETNNYIIADTTVFTSPPGRPAIISFNTITNSSFTVVHTNQASLSTTYYSFSLNNIQTPTKDQGVAVAIFNNLTAATTYSVIVTANNNIGANSSNAQSVTTLIDTPNPATNIDSGAGTTLTALNVTWTASPNATLPYTFTINGSPAVPQSQTTNQATFINLTPDTYYTVVVIANNSTGGRPSQPADLITAPSAPRNVTISYANPTGFTVSWLGVSPYYLISLNGGTPLEVQTSPYVFTNLSVGNTYEVVVSAKNESGVTPAPPVIYALGLTTPQIQYFNNVQATSFNVTWSLSTGADPVMYFISFNGGESYPFYSVTNSYALTNMNPNTTYTVLVKAISNGVIKTSNPVTVITKPAPPYDITFTNPLPSTVTVNWLTADSTTPPLKPILTLGAVTGTTAQISWTPPTLSVVSSYSLNVNALGFQSFPSSVTSYTITNLTPITSNTAFLIANNTAGRTDADPVYFMTPNYQIPLTPDNFRTTSIGETTIGVRWDASVDATIYYLSSDGSNFPFTVQAPTTIFTFSSLTASTPYILRIKANNPVGYSQPSNALSVTTNVAAPSSVSTPTLSSQNTTSFTVSWTGGNGATYYEYKLNGTFVTAATDNGVAQKNATFNASIGNTYTVEVIAYNSAGEASSGTGLTVTMAPGQPSSLTSSNITYDSFTVSWAQPGYTSGITYTYTLNGSAPSSVTTSGTSATFSSLTGSTLYAVIVTARNANGLTTASSSLSVTTATLPKPTKPILSLTGTTSTSFTISWTGGLYATSYSYKIDGILINNDDIIDNGVSAKTATFNGSPNNTYTVEVIAINASDSTSSNGIWSQPSIINANAKLYAIASSADGTKLVTAGQNDFIYTSTDSGVTWIQRTASGFGNWRGFASSADGTKLVTGRLGAYILTSTDSGITWTQRTGPGIGNWLGFASSSDGTKLITGSPITVGGRFDGSGYVIYTSSDSGVTWLARDSTSFSDAQGFASSEDGIKLLTGKSSNPSNVYTSTDSGVTWIIRGGAGGIKRGYASSANGNKLVTGDANTYIYTSTDSGVSWTPYFGEQRAGWYSFASSADGNTLIAGSSYSNYLNGYIYISSNSGITWTAQTEPGIGDWTGVASSADGNKLFGVNTGPYIYKYASTFSVTIA